MPPANNSLICEGHLTPSSAPLLGFLPENQVPFLKTQRSEDNVQLVQNPEDGSTGTDTEGGIRISTDTAAVTTDRQLAESASSPLE